MVNINIRNLLAPIPSIALGRGGVQPVDEGTRAGVMDIQCRTANIEYRLIRYSTGFFERYGSRSKRGFTPSFWIPCGIFDIRFHVDLPLMAAPSRQPR